MSLFEPHEIEEVDAWVLAGPPRSVVISGNNQNGKATHICQLMENTSVVCIGSGGSLLDSLKDCANQMPKGKKS